MWLPAEDLSYLPPISKGTFAVLGLFIVGAAGSFRRLMSKMGKLKVQ